MENLRVAGVCMHAEPGDIKGNLKRLRSLALRAAAEGAEVACFPELCLTGYELERPRSLCRSYRWRSMMGQLVETARQARLTLVAGLIETAEDGSGPYITQVVAGPEGLLGSYRKTHLSPVEKGVYRCGDEISVFACGPVTLGIQLCYEAHFPEISTAMALMGAHVILFPHASPRGTPRDKLESWLRHLRARAFDNGVFAVACNQTGATDCGMNFPGVVVFVAPDGQVMDSYAGGEERIVVADLRGEALERVRNHRMRYFLPARRPELYRRICE